MNEFCAKKGIKREYSIARTPQQNGVAERKNRTLIEAARTMLADSLLPIQFWAEAVNTACYVLNRVLVTKPQMKTPYEILMGRSPNISKFDGKSETLSVGYSTSKQRGNVSTYDDVEDLDDQQFIVHGPSINAAQNKHSEERIADKKFQLNAFEEEKRRIALEKGKESANSTLTLSTANTPSQSTGNTPTDSDDDGSQRWCFLLQILWMMENYRHEDSQIIGKSTAGVLTRRKLKESASDQHQALLSFMYKQNRTNHKDQQTCLFACFLSQEEPKKVSQALADENGKRVIGTKWVFRNKRDERGTIIKNKARLVAQGYRQEEGVDYDEVFAPVARIEAIRLFLAFASFMGFTVYQMDVKSAFFIENITEVVYVKLPYRRGAIDKTLFIKKDRRDIMLVQVYVDDIIFGSTKPSMVKDFEELMQKEFKMSSMGELTFFLGLQVKQTTAGFKSLQRILLSLEAFSDSDYAGDNHDRRSTSGGCQYLGGRLVSWQCKKQTIMAISSTEAEYVAAASCCAENPVLHSKTKHIQIRHHFIRDCYEQRLINVVKVHTDDNVADLLTKGFDLARFNFLVVTIESLEALLLRLRGGYE
ncbi:zinc finger, CCHC-type containing protein [Tanacetum coccineum]